MNDLHCQRCHRFISAERRERRRGELLALMQGDRRPSEPHCRAERTKSEKRAARRLEHLRRWLDAGVIVPKAVRLLGGGNG